MKNKPFEMCLLFDFYGDYLTDKQKELFDLYYNEDLSLTEISENNGITRQGVRDGIMRAETILRDLEAKLGLVKRYGKIQTEVTNIANAAQKIAIINAKLCKSQDISVLVDSINNIATGILEQ